MFSLKFENENGGIVDVNDGVNYIVLSVGGINPPSASIYTSKSPNRKGAKYNGSSLAERNIVVDIKLLGDVEANRNALYSWTNSEQYCKVHFRNGVRNVYCEGYVEECAVDPFTDNEIVSVAILCTDPFWKSLQEISTEISMLLKQFVFPFAIDENGIPFSTLRENSETNIFYSGAETGVTIEIRCTDDIQNLIIYDPNDTTRTFRLNTTLSQGWVLIINTDGSPKTCTVLKPDGTTQNMMKYVVGGSTWFTLKNGNNFFGLTADSGAEGAEMTVKFQNKYLGV